METKEEGWAEWLGENGRASENLEEDKVYRSCLLFKDVKFGAVPRKEWYEYYQDLLPFESSLVNGTTTDYCGVFPFKFPMTDLTPFR